MAEMKKETGELGMIGPSINWRGGQKLHRLLAPNQWKKIMQLSACGWRVYTLDYLLETSGLTHPWLPLTHACRSCFRGINAYTSGPISENMVTFTTWTQEEINGL